MSLTPYQRTLFVFLGVATFFEGFDQMALAQLLPALRAEFALSELGTGAMVTVINVGTVLAYVLVRQADRWGRRPVLSVTIVGYTTFSFLSGLAPDVHTFTVAQLVARIFLIGEWVVSMIYAAEEFPAERRGTIIGIICAFGSLGAVVCAGVAPLLAEGPWGWRTVYFAGTLPLIGLAIARRSVRETERFLALSPEERRPSPLLRVFRTPYRGRVLRLALIWACIYVCTQTAITFFKQHAVEDLGMADKTVGLLIGGAAVLSMPAVFGAGKLLDVAGRRGGAAIIFALASVGVLGAYTLTHPVLLFAALVLAVFGAAAVLPALNAFNAELFPTHLRSDAFAWSNNILGRSTFVLAPLAVGAAAERVGWGPAVAATALGPLIALVLVLRWLPETRGQELEESSTLQPQPP